MKTIKVNITTDTRAFFARIKRGESRLAYAVINALNGAALAVQAAEQARLETGEDKFTVRKPTFLKRQIALIGRKNFASIRHGRATVEVSIGQKERLFLSAYEEGGSREPFVGRNVALPRIGGPTRRSKSSRVPPSLTFQSLDFKKAKNSKLWIGNANGGRKVFLTPGKGVWRYLSAAQKKTAAGVSRSGVGPIRAKRRTETLYRFWKPGDPRINPKRTLRWQATARLAYIRSFNELMEKEKIKSLAHGGLI